MGLARAMAADPSVMLMDEPFAAIDNITRRRLQDELLTIQSKLRKTILFRHPRRRRSYPPGRQDSRHARGKVVQYDTPLHILIRARR